jgi:hypothetical protein
MPVVFVCCGSNCRGRKKARKELVAALELVARVEHVDCQKICKGPVAGVEVAGKLEWFSDLRKDKARRKLVTLIEEGKLARSLQKRWVKKRSGKKRGCGCGAEVAATGGAASATQARESYGGDIVIEPAAEAPDTSSGLSPAPSSGE